MTGYGSAKCELSFGVCSIELRSLNGKSLDLSMRTPAWCRPIESELRSMVSSTVLRGKTELNITMSGGTGGVAKGIDHEVFKAYYNELRAIALELGVECSGWEVIGSILRLPDVVGEAGSELSDDDRLTIVRCVEEALRVHTIFREREGEVLLSDILRRVDVIGALLLEVEQFETERIATVRNRIAENLSKASVQVDENRFEGEIIYYLEKYDVTEEKVRLAEHLEYFRVVSQGGDELGRKLGFVAQEMGREINTLGSKANHSGMQRLVVGMKDELEKIKEQLLNIL